MVTNSNNSGPGSLRQSITDANNNPGPDIITFAAALDGNPIILAGAADEDANAAGDLDILDGGDLTLQGNGAANTAIDGGGIDRVFHICPGGGCANTVTLIGLTIRNGKSVQYGGGIFGEGGTLTINSSSISANTAVFGGGIYNLAPLNIINGSMVGGAGAGNTADYGGGIYNDGYGNITVDSSAISANSAGDGGGIYNFGGELTLRNGSIIGGAGVGNKANRGGAIFNDLFGTTTVDGSTISANTAIGGGGVYNDHSTLIIQNNSIIGGPGAGNKADGAGGGVLNLVQSVTIVDGSTISANEAGSGGAVATAVISDLIVKNESTIGGAGAGNKATEEGGGIHAKGWTTIENSTVSANTAAENGGGIYNGFGGTLTVDGSTINANETGGNGGGIFNASDVYFMNGTTKVTGSRILNNTAAGSGGGVYNERDLEGATSVTGSCIVGNSASSYFNNRPAQQIATGNWWGVPSGPDTPGADTHGGNIDVSSHLTTPILGCPPNNDGYLPVVLK